MINLLLNLLIVCLVAGVGWWIIGLFSPPDIIKKVATVVLVIVCLVWLIGILGGDDGNYRVIRGGRSGPVIVR